MATEPRGTTTEITKTQFGLPIDESFSKPASKAQVEKTAISLRLRNITVEVVDTVQKAREFVNSILPTDKEILTVSSETVRLSGLADDINVSGRFLSIRQKLAKMDPKTQRRDMIRMGATPDIVVGSVHAITEEGQVLVGSATGSQLGPYSSGAAKVIWVVGSQKVVPSFETGLRRLQYYSYPKEDIRTRERLGKGSALAKMLTVNTDEPGRTTAVLVRESIGF